MDSTTPTADVVKSRPRLINLAKVVFGHETTSTFRAFGQFRHNSHLAQLIDAKREGKFDYGVLIKETDAGATWPDSEIVMNALKEAEENGTLSETTCKYLGIEDEAELAKVLMQKPKRKSTRKKPAAKKDPPKKAAPKKTRAKKPAPEPDPEPDQIEHQMDHGDNHADAPIPLPVATDLAPLLDRLDVLSNDLADSLQKAVDYADDRLEAVLGKLSAQIEDLDEKVTTVLGVQALLGKMIEATNKNLETVGQYLDPHLELPLIVDGLPDFIPDLDEEDEPPNDSPPTNLLTADDDEDELPPEPESEPEPEPEEEPEEEAEDGEAVIHYTDEQLQGKSLEELIQIAEDIGIADAHLIAFRGAAIRKIKKAQA
jgi:hypothetical protein